jgi:hypothetical protein
LELEYKDSNLISSTGTDGIRANLDIAELPVKPLDMVCLHYIFTTVGKD